MVQLGFSDIWEAQSLELLKSRKLDIYSTFYNELINDDWESLQVSSYGGHLNNLKLQLATYQPGVAFPSPYLLNNMPIIKLRTIAQLRLAGKVVKIYLNGMMYEWDQNEMCTNCELGQLESLNHFFKQCSLYEQFREVYIRALLQAHNNEITSLLNTENRSDISKIFGYVQAALRIRSFIRNE